MNRSRRFLLTPSLRRSIFTTTILLTTLQRSSIVHTTALSQGASGSTVNNNSSSNPMSTSTTPSSADSSTSTSISASAKTAQELQIQWAGGRDVWPRVPIIGGEGEGQGQFVSIQTKVKGEHPAATTTATIDIMEWPDIVKQSTMFGFGAYNPRGQTLPDDINIQQHALLRNDLEQSISPPVIFWESAAIWEDGSWERGFMVAFPKSNNEQEGQELCVNLAKKYNQGAIYKYVMEEEETNGALHLMRDTVAVLDEGTDARVEVEIDTDADLSSFLESIR